MPMTMNDGRVTLHHGDSRDVLRELADNSIDSVVCDPPYALVSISKRFGKDGAAPAQHGTDGAYARASAGFMGKQWDTGEAAFAVEFWAEVYRVLKPGGHVLAFGGTRTYHRLACAIEDAGFEIRDSIAWIYGSGFPKSHNQHGDWEGWGTALKPAIEPIVVARKPLDGTNAQNLARWGVGALNIDGCRVALDGDYKARPNGRPSLTGLPDGYDPANANQPHDLGRWPANIIHDGSDEVLEAFPETTSGAMRREVPGYDGDSVTGFLRGKSGPSNQHGDSGSAARFFYCAKASRADRDAGLDHLPKKAAGLVSETSGQHITRRDEGYVVAPRANTHPTVKPTDLMRYLCRLVTPPGGTVLDPFMGSGSTGKAAVLEGFQFVGIEREDEYVPIAAARIAWAVDEAKRPAAKPKKPPANDNPHIPDLFGSAA